MSDYTSVEGAIPFEPLRVDLVPGRTVIVHIDLQNDFLHDDGHYGKSGIDVSHMQRVIDPINALTAEARRADYLDPPRHQGCRRRWPVHATSPLLERGRFAPTLMGIRGL